MQYKSLNGKFQLMENGDVRKKAQRCNDVFKAHLRGMLDKETQRCYQGVYVGNVGQVNALYLQYC
jgi:hypothetical protein